MTTTDLPLFAFTENRGNLKRLQERRNALLKRLQGLAPQSRKRAGLAYELSLLTSKLLRQANANHGRMLQ